MSNISPGYSWGYCPTLDPEDNSVAFDLGLLYLVGALRYL